MGFFVKEEVRPKKAAKEEASAGEFVGCENCNLREEWGRLSTPIMELTGAPCGDILVMGEAPGENEDVEGKAFVGDSGQFLRSELPRRFADRLVFGNAVRCRPPGNRTPTRREVACCDVFFQADAEEKPIRAILGLGAVPLNKFLPEALITNTTGVRFPVEAGGRVLWYFSSFHPSFVLRGGGKDSPQYPVFRADIRKFFREVDRWPKPCIEWPDLQSVRCALTREEAAAVLTLGSEVGFDLETSTLHPWTKGARILSAAVSDGENTVAWPVDHPAYRSDWGLPLLFDVLRGRRWVAHNSVFELSWLIWAARQAGVDLGDLVFGDSQAAARLYFERPGILSLGMVSRLVLGVDIKKMTSVQGDHILDYPLEEVLLYNGLDAWSCRQVEKRLAKQVSKEYYARLTDTCLSIAHMQVMGLHVDVEANQRLREDWSLRARQEAEAARSLYEARRFEEDRQKEFNISSAADVGEALVAYGRIELPRTSSGKQYSTDDEILNNHSATNPLARGVLAFRNAQKNASTYGDGVAKALEKSADGLLHPTYNPFNVVTYRLSSNDPNIQNFPKRRDKDVRHQIVAPPGHVFAAFDSGQIQARIFGMASRDKNLCDNFRDPKSDIHSYWLDRLVNTYYPDYLRRVADLSGEREEEKIWKAARTLIKSDFTFASFFGSSAESASEGTGVPYHLMKELLAEFWGYYPDGLRWLKARRREYADTGGVLTLTGQFRYGVMQGNEPVITPIQNGESLLILGAQNELSKLSRETGDPYLHPRMNVHDDLSFILPSDNEDRLEEYVRTISAAMVRVRFDWQIVPLTVEVQIGPDWGSLEEIAVIVGDYAQGYRGNR